MHRTLSTEELSELTGSIYDCALDPEHWPETLAAIRKSMDFHNAVLGLNLLPSGTVLLNATSGIEDTWLQRIPAYADDIVRQWGGVQRLMQHPLAEPAVCSTMNSEGTTDRNRYFREWARPQGLTDVMALALARDSTALGTLAFGRHSDAGPITAYEVDTGRLLIPHLQRSVAISRMLDAKSVARNMFESAIDALSVAVIFTNTRLEVLHANPVAERMLTAGVPMSLKSGRLSIGGLGVAEALVQAVAGAAANGTELGARGRGVPVWSKDGRPFVFHVLPLKSGELRSNLKVGAAAAIFISPVFQSLPMPGPDFFSLFDLTRREADVFQKIVTGSSIADIAQTSEVAISTIKTHLQRIFAKTGCRRQSDLVALAASMRLPVGHG